MKKLSDMLERKLLPMANRFSKQRHLKAVSNAFLSIVPFLTIGSLALVLISPPVDYTTLEPGFLCSFFQGWASLAQTLSTPVGSIYTICMEFMSIFVAAAIGYFLAQEYQMKGFLPPVLTTVAFLILAGLGVDGSKTVDYFGGTGLFTAIISSMAAIELLHFLHKRRIGYISLEGQGVPEALTQAFALLIPTAITLIGIGVIHWIIISVSGDTLPALMTLIMTPILGATDSFPGVLLLAFLVMTFWWFGIHDSCITGPMTAFWTIALTANIAAYNGGAATTAVPYIVTDPYWFMFLMIGGSGATFGLCLTLLFFCKSKQLKTVGKLSIVPAFFNINEPIIFGVPLMLNPVMFIPFVGAVLMNCVVSYGAMFFGLVGRTIAQPGWNMFAPIGGLISTLDIKAILLIVFLIIMDAIIYLPFVKVYDKQKYEEELSADTAESK